MQEPMVKRTTFAWAAVLGGLTMAALIGAALGAADLWMARVLMAMLVFGLGWSASAVWASDVAVDSILTCPLCRYTVQRKSFPKTLQALVAHMQDEHDVDRDQ